MIAYNLVSQANSSLSKMKEELDENRNRMKDAESNARCARVAYQAHEVQVRAVCAMLATATGRVEVDLLKSVGLSPIEPPKPAVLKRGQEA